MNLTMNDSTILIIAVAVLLLAIVLVLLARTGRRPPEGPAIEMPSEYSPVTPDEPLPEPGAAPGLATAELAPGAEPIALGPPDPLTRMKGLGPKAEALLNGLGVTRFDQIAGWNEGDVARVDAQMGNFKGRIARDRWVEQAGFLARDDVAGFEERFGKLG